MRGLIRRFDALLRHLLGISTFCRDEECLLRIRLVRLSRELTLPGGHVAKGELVLELHLWNEHILPPPAAGPDPAWALRMGRMFVGSLRGLAAHVQQKPELQQARAVGGVTVLFTPERPAGIRFMERLGFVVFHHRHPLGRFGEFWENLYAWALMWAYNPASLRHRTLWGLSRMEVWMRMEDFLQRYG
ncbi:MAG: hypothetical protein D6775_17100 [Caldilineae bacterium]|nr:MAG: hypothetical protein D6775_17100 [Caldilineae bacterium]